MDDSAQTSMKNAASRDIYYELQVSVNHRNFERTAPGFTFGHIRLSDNFYIGPFSSLFIDGVMW